MGDLTTLSVTLHLNLNYLRCWFLLLFALESNDIISLCSVIFNTRTSIKENPKIWWKDWLVLVYILDIVVMIDFKSRFELNQMIKLFDRRNKILFTRDCLTVLKLVRLSMCPIIIVLRNFRWIVIKPFNVNKILSFNFFFVFFFCYHWKLKWLFTYEKVNVFV